MNNLKNYIREIPDWPKPGVNFKDIAPLLQDPNAFRFAVQKLIAPYSNHLIDKLVGIDARGFIFAAASAYKLKKGLVMVRKKGKLPRSVTSRSYELEYGNNELELQTDSITKGENVLVIDDVLATGGTAKAVAELIDKLGGKVAGFAFLIELTPLKGREMLRNHKISSIIKY